MRPEGIEPPAYRFEACRSIHLSYGRHHGRCASVADVCHPHWLPRGKDSVVTAHRVTRRLVGCIGRRARRGRVAGNGNSRGGRLTDADGNAREAVRANPAKIAIVFDAERIRCRDLEARRLTSEWRGHTARARDNGIPVLESGVWLGAVFRAGRCAIPLRGPVAQLAEQQTLNLSGVCTTGPAQIVRESPLR